MDAINLRPFVEALAAVAVDAFGVNNQLITWLYATPVGEVYGVTLEDQAATAPVELGDDVMVGIRVLDAETGVEFIFQGEKFYALSFDFVTGRSNGWWAVLAGTSIQAAMELAMRQSEAYKLAQGQAQRGRTPACWTNNTICIFPYRLFDGDACPDVGVRCEQDAREHSALCRAVHGGDPRARGRFRLRRRHIGDAPRHGGV